MSSPKVHFWWVCLVKWLTSLVKSALGTKSPSHLASIEAPCHLDLVGGFKPSEKYEANWIISPGKDENKTYLKPPPSYDHVLSIVISHLEIFRNPHWGFHATFATSLLNFRGAQRISNRTLTRDDKGPYERSSTLPFLLQVFGPCSPSQSSDTQTKALPPT